MRFGDVSPWRLPTTSGQHHAEKGNPGSLVLPAQALAIIESMPRLAGNSHVFAGNGAGPKVFFKPDPTRWGSTKNPACTAGSFTMCAAPRAR